MKGLWLEEGVVQWRDDLPLPEPPAGEALVRVLCAGICRTDLELVEGYSSFVGVPGHEFVGRVERGPREWVGERVVGEINAACGRCEVCRRGRSNHCPHRTVLGIAGRNGAFAEYLTLPVENLHRVPAEVSTEAATFVEPLAAALQIQQQVRISPGDRVLVVGDGKLGQLIGQTLALTGCELLVIGRHPDKLEHLARRGICTGTGERVERGGFDLAVECTGNPEGFALARRGLRPQGTLVLKSTYVGGLNLEIAALVVDELTLVGSRCGPFAPALRLLATGRVEVEALISARYPLEEGPAAFVRARQKGVLKVLLKISSEEEERWLNA